MKISFVRPLPHLSGTYIGKNIWIKNNTNATAYKEYLKDILDTYQNCNMFYTDASNTGG